jgi:ferredoxin-NADP reductase
MGFEFIHWLQDVREYSRVSKRRKGLRQPGRGVDYKNDAYQDVVRRTVSRIHPRRMTLQVKEIVQETPTTKTFRFERRDGPVPPFRPGQYITLFIEVEGILTSRPYSLSSVPEAGYLDITVRDKAEGFVAPYLLKRVEVGHELESSGPAGTFYYEPLIDGEDLVFLAGGSGITPFMSMIRHAVHRKRPLKMHLLYGSRRPEDVIFGGELARLADSRDNFGFSLVISEPPRGYQGLTGFLSAERIREHVGDLEGKTFYLCGPREMTDFCLAALKELRVPPWKIRQEVYGPPEDVTHEAGWPEGLSGDTLFKVTLAGRGSIPARAGEPLLNALERHGVVVPALCRSGACSACRMRLLSGRVFMPAHTGIRESDRQDGFIHACVSYPLEDLEIKI